LMFDDPVLQGEAHESEAGHGPDQHTTLEQLIRTTQQQIMCNVDFEKCVNSNKINFVGIVLVDGRHYCSTHHTDFDVLSRAISDKVCELYNLDVSVKKEIIQQLLDHGEWHGDSCSAYYGTLQEVDNLI